MKTTTELKLMMKEADLVLTASAGAGGSRLEGLVQVKKGTISLAGFVNDILPSGLRFPAELGDVQIESGSVVMDSATGEFSFGFKAETALDFGDFGAIKGREIHFSYQRAQANKAECWLVKVVGGINLLREDFGSKDSPYRIGLAGSLEVELGATNRFSFVSDKDASYVKLPTFIPGEGKNVEVLLGLDILEIKQSKTAEGGQAWGFQSVSWLKLEHLNKTIATVFPEKLKTRFSLDHRGATVELLDAVSFEMALPPLELDAQNKIALGTAAFSLSTLSLTLGKNISASVAFGIGLPSELNRIFGMNEQKEPVLKLFNTYDAANRDTSLVKVAFSAGTDGVSLNLLTSPLACIDFIPEGGVTWCYLNFGPYGKIRFKVPVFSYTEGAFKASGGFEVVEPLSLPLGLLKQLLKAAKAEKAAAILPEKLPLQSVSLIDEHKNFRIEEALRLASQMGITLPDEVVGYLRALVQNLDKLPDGLKEYLNIQIPDGLLFDIALTPDGGARFDVSVPDPNKPIRLLYPSLEPLPVLNGITLRSISFGEILAGNFFLLKMDACFDQFDLASIAASYLLEAAGSPYLPNMRKFQRRVIIKNLFMVIDYKTIATFTAVPVPIPIPLFYDELGVEYYGIEGLEMQAHASFPMPKFNFSELTSTFSDLLKFFTDKNFLLDPEKAPKDMDLRFTLNRNYVELPKYLGGQLLGAKEKNFEVSLFKSVATLMNGIKTLTLNRLIQVVPLDYRVGNVQSTLGFLKSDATWIITTPREFRDTAHQLFHIAPGDTQSFIEVLPAVQRPGALQTDEQGLVVFLKGNTQIADVAGLEAKFGLAASPSMGFHTGFKIKGRIAQILDMEMGGVVSVPKAPAEAQGKGYFNVAGHTHFLLSGHELFAGDILITNEKFYTKGQFHLFPKNAPLNVSGSIEGGGSENGEFLVRGNVNFSTGLLGGVIAGAEASIRNSGVMIDASLLGQRTSFAVQDTGSAVKLDMQVSLLNLHTVLTVNKDGSGGGGTLTADIPGLLGVRSGLNLGPVSSGNLSIDLLGLRDVVNGHLHVGPGYLELFGRLNINFLNLVKLYGNGDGRIDQNGLRFTTHSTLDIGIDVPWPVNRIGFIGTGEVRLVNGELTSTLKAFGKVGAINLPGVDVTTSLRMWKGEPCFMAAFLLGGIIGAGDKHLLAISPTKGIIHQGSWWKTWGDDVNLGWPMDLRPTW